VRLQFGDLIVLNLITKDKVYQKPKKVDFMSALISLRKMINKWAITKLSMPMIGTGLDMMKEEFVMNCLVQEMSKCNVTIDLYKL
jgi:hypothetical protein